MVAVVLIDGGFGWIMDLIDSLILWSNYAPEVNPPPMNYQTTELYEWLSSDDKLNKILIELGNALTLKQLSGYIVDLSQQTDFIHRSGINYESIAFRFIMSAIGDHERIEDDE